VSCPRRWSSNSTRTACTNGGRDNPWGVEGVPARGAAGGGGSRVGATSLQSWPPTDAPAAPATTARHAPTTSPASANRHRSRQDPSNCLAHRFQQRGRTSPPTNPVPPTGIGPKSRPREDHVLHVNAVGPIQTIGQLLRARVPAVFEAIAVCGAAAACRELSSPTCSRRSSRWPVD
jgi:hypothetical protein